MYGLHGNISHKMDIFRLIICWVTGIWIPARVEFFCNGPSGLTAPLPLVMKCTETLNFKVLLTKRMRGVVLPFLLSPLVAWRLMYRRKFNWIINHMQHSASWATFLMVTQLVKRFFKLLWNPKCVHMSPSAVPIHASPNFERDLPCMWQTLHIYATIYNIVTCMCVSIDGVRIGHAIYWLLIHSRLVTTLQWSVTHTDHCPQSVTVSNTRFLATDLNNGDSSASVLTSLPAGWYSTTELSA
jgi:hypothetical protein